MITVVDHVSPWLTPRNPFATSTQVHVGAHISRNGTGTATSQPAIRICLRPIAVRESSSNVVRDRLGQAKDADEGQDGGPSRKLKLLFRKDRQDAALHPDHRTNEGVDDEEHRELSDVLAEPQTNGRRRAASCAHRHALVRLARTFLGCFGEAIELVRYAYAREAGRLEYARQLCFQQSTGDSPCPGDPTVRSVGLRRGGSRRQDQQGTSGPCLTSIDHLSSDVKKADDRDVQRSGAYSLRVVKQRCCAARML